MAARLKLLALALVSGCTARPDGAAPSAPTDSPSTPDPARAQRPTANASPPINTDPLVDAGLPCREKAECQHQARFAYPISVLSASGAVITRGEPSSSEGTPFGPPRVLVPEGGLSPAALVRVVCASEALTIEARLAYEALRPVATEFVVAKPQPSTKGDAGISLAPGSVVELGRKSGEQQEVLWSGSIEARGWVPESSIGPTFIEATSDPRDVPNEWRMRDVKTAIPLRSHAGGPQFGQFSGWVHVQRLSDATRGDVKIAVAGWDTEIGGVVIGWAPKNQLDNLPLMGILASPRAPSEDTYITVARGELLETLAGEHIAAVTDDVSLRCTADCDTPVPVVDLDCVLRFPARVRVPVHIN